jgi:hypothetical protein
MGWALDSFDAADCLQYGQVGRTRTQRLPQESHLTTMTSHSGALSAIERRLHRGGWNGKLVAHDTLAKASADPSVSAPKSQRTSSAMRAGDPRSYPCNWRTASATVSLPCT